MFRDEIETSENHFSWSSEKNEADSRREFPGSRILADLWFESAQNRYLSKKEFGQTREGCLQMSHSTEENFFPHILGFDDIQWISNKTDREKPES